LSLSGYGLGHRGNHFPGVPSDLRHPGERQGLKAMTRDKQTAADLAERLHAGQVGKFGEPYIVHLRRVVGILLVRFPDVGFAEIEAAWLHGTLKDTGATPSSLASDGVSEDTLRIVQMLTRPGDFGYLDWIRVIAAGGDRSAIRVKLADIEDNQDPRRAGALSARTRIIAERYAPAREILLQALRPSAAD
jgi:hypothetical protein